MSEQSGQPATNPVEIPEELYIVPLKEMVIFPGVMIPLFFTNEDAIAAVNKVMMGDHILGLVARRKGDAETPAPEDLYGFGSAVRTLQVLKLPEGGIKVMVEGLARIRVLEYFREDAYLKAKVEEVREFYEKNLVVDALIHSVISLFKVAMAMGRPL